MEKERKLIAAKEKCQVAYNGKPNKITSDFLMETCKARNAWTDVLQTLRDQGCQPRIPYPAKC